jgi:glycosyltransferase involved in cell wall biosynthesis
VTDAPRVSVVLPTYNRATVLGASMESVLDQTYRDLELLVVDDGSTDDTAAVVDSVDDPRVAYLAHEQNRGVSAARNTGIEAARGDVVAFQDSDDEWAPEKLAAQMAVFDAAPPEVGVVYTGMWREVGDDRRYLPPPDVAPKEGDVNDALARQNFVSTQMAAVRASCFETAGAFDEDLPALVDWDLWLRLARDWEFRLVDEPLVTAPLRGDSISTDRTAIVDARARIARKYADQFDDDALARHLFYVGHGAMKAGQGARGRAYLWRAVRTAPDPLYAAWAGLALLGPGPYRAAYRTVKRLRNAGAEGAP